MVRCYLSWLENEKDELVNKTKRKEFCINLMIDFKLYLIDYVENSIKPITECIFTKLMLLVVLLTVVKAFTSQILTFVLVDDYDCFITISYKLFYLIIIIIIVPDDWFYSSGFGWLYVFVFIVSVIVCWFGMIHPFDLIHLILNIERRNTVATFSFYTFFIEK